MTYNVLPKLLEIQRETLQNKKVVSSEYCIEGKDIQNLFLKNKTLAITKPLEFVVSHFFLSCDVLRESISIETSGEGFIAVLQMKSINPKGGFHRFKQISETVKSRRPVFDLLDDQIEWSYRSRSGAIISLLLHMLLNLSKKHDASWMLHYLQHTKEVLILVPLSDNLGTMEVVATIFRTTKKRGSPVLCRFFRSTNDVLPWFEVGQDTFGFFDGTFLKAPEY